MKKLIGTAMLAALLATSAFAELNMGAWVRTMVAPVAGDGDNIISGWANSWGYGIRNARISFNWTSDDEKVGMMYDIFGDGASGFGSGDYRAAWFKPADWVKFMVGHIDNGYTMRGDLCFGSWNWMRPNNWLFDDEGLTFNLGNADALQVEFFPVEGLQILGRFAMPADGGFQDSYKMFEQSTFAVGYTIGSVGTIKAAWNGKGTREYKNKGHDAGYGVVVGDNAYYYASKKVVQEAVWALQEKGGPASGSDDKKLLDALYYNGKIKDSVVSKENYFDAVDPSGERKYWGDIQAAFDLTAVENLYITVGVKVSIAESDYKDLVEDFAFLKAALGVSYQILDNLRIAANFGVQTYEVADPSFQFGVGVDVGLTDSLTLSADFRGLIPGDGAGLTNADDPAFSFLVGLDWGFSGNGQLGIGFQGSTNGYGILAGSGYIAPADDSFSWAVPLKFSYWF